MTCTLHDVIEVEDGIPIYPYRCSRCGGCFFCQHELIGYKFWVCLDGDHKPTTPDKGVPVNAGENDFLRR